MLGIMIALVVAIALVAVVVGRRGRPGDHHAHNGEHHVHTGEAHGHVVGGSSSAGCG